MAFLLNLAQPQILLSRNLMLIVSLLLRLLLMSWKNQVYWWLTDMNANILPSGQMYLLLLVKRSTICLLTSICGECIFRRSARAKEFVWLMMYCSNKNHSRSATLLIITTQLCLFQLPKSFFCSCCKFSHCSRCAPSSVEDTKVVDPSEISVDGRFELMANNVDVQHSWNNLINQCSENEPHDVIFLYTIEIQ